MQLEQNRSQNYEHRILRMKNKVISQQHEICVERARLITESFKKTKGENLDYES